MKTQHTQGPWNIDTWDFIDNGKIQRKELVIVNSKNKLATIECDWPELCPRKTENPWQIPNSEAFFNARLMASAPELIEALEKCVLVIEREGIENIFLDQARKIIDKAKGNEDI